MKALLRELAARTIRTLEAAIITATEAVTQRDAEGGFLHRGDAVPCDG